ncbi:MAG: elongation factor P [Candidatus Cloacimonetes bacterium]|nr:elongation factor P [Candidatus Cloacimonadota bacterium]MBS3767037.1 elongation factor P [Candidatus Cloacimonadota bacterium]
MASTSDFRNGMIIRYKNGLYEIVDFQHVKPGKGAAFVRTKLKNIRNGSVLDNTFRSGAKVEEVRVEKQKMEYLYNDSSIFVVMDPDTYQQVELDEGIVGDKKYFLTENIDITLVKTKEQIIKILLPTTVNLVVSECEPGVRGDTVTNVTKEATLETGLKIQLPMFINKGDVVKVDTRTGEYIERVN